MEILINGKREEIDRFSQLIPLKSSEGNYRSLKEAIVGLSAQSFDVEHHLCA